MIRRVDCNRDKKWKYITTDSKNSDVRANKRDIILQVDNSRMQEYFPVNELTRNHQIHEIKQPNTLLRSSWSHFSIMQIEVNDA